MIYNKAKFVGFLIKENAVKYVALSLLTFFLFSCQRSNLLNFKYYRYQKEHKFMEREQDIVLNQWFRYDEPRVCDEEIATFFTITIKDSVSFVKQKKVKVEAPLNDSVIIVQMNDFCFGFCHETNFYCHGEIELLKWDNKMIKIRENIFVTNDDKYRPIRILKGVRTFKNLKN